MKLKIFTSIVTILVLIVAIFSSLAASAPPPTVNTPLIMDTFITNTNDDPVPVDIIDDSLEVEVTNNLDVSGWLHTTESGRVYEPAVTDDYHDMIRINTKGFRALTINYYTYGDDCDFLLYMNVWTSPSSYAGIDVKSETIAHGQPTTITYDVTSDFVDVLVTPTTGGPTIVAVTYYMTT